MNLYFHFLRGHMHFFFEQLLILTWDFKITSTKLHVIVVLHQQSVSSCNVESNIFASEDSHARDSTSAFNRNGGGFLMKKLHFGRRLYIISVSEASSKCCEVSASSLPLVRNSKRLLFQALHLRDVTITVVTGSPVVEQKRKQEVNAAKPQVVLRRPACIPLVAASFVMDAQRRKQSIWLMFSEFENMV